MLVIGGGITGCGVALDAVTRGLRTALVERDDFASGTSSKSSKLVHGGLRYLQQGDMRLVYQALHERQRLLRNAPHLVAVLPFLVPVLTKDGPVSKKIAKAMRSALWMYDLTGGARIGKLHRRLDADQSLAHCPTLPADRLSSGFVYYDAATDDARLTLTIARTAAAARCGRRQPLRGARADTRRRRRDRRRRRRHRRRTTSTCGRASWCRRPACGPTSCAASTRASTPTRSDPPRASTSRSPGDWSATTSP